MASQELNAKMHHLHLDDDNRWDAFLETDDENGHKSHPVYGANYDDDLFLDSDDDDGFLESDEDDEFLDTGEEDERMDGVDVMGYPWPNEMDGREEEWLDQIDDHTGHADLDEGLFDFDHLSASNEEGFQLGVFPATSYHPIDLHNNDWLQVDDEFLNSDTEDHLDQDQILAAPPLSEGSHQSHPPDDINIDEDDFLVDIETTEVHLPTPYHVPPTISPRSSSIPNPTRPIQYILPRSPQFSLGQAGAMICDQDLHQEEDHEDEFLDSDLESEIGFIVADQYLPTPDQVPDSVESEMGVYSVDQEFLDTDVDFESEMGDTTHHNAMMSEEVGYINTQALNPDHNPVESEMGIYTVDQSEHSQASSSLGSLGPTSFQAGIWEDDDEEEVVYRIPSMPVDMRHYQYPLEGQDDDFLMSDEEGLPTTPDRCEPIRLNGEVPTTGNTDDMEVDCSHERNRLTDAQPLFSDIDVLPFYDAELDEAMPA
jgi:hypothetical protein